MQSTKKDKFFQNFICFLYKPINGTINVILHLMPHNAVFIVKAVIWTGVIGACQEPAHLVFVKVCHASEAIVIIVIDIVHTGLAVGRFSVLHRSFLL